MNSSVARDDFATNNDWLFGFSDGYSSESDNGEVNDEIDETNNSIDDNDFTVVDVTSLFLHDDLSIAMKRMRSDEEGEIFAVRRGDFKQKDQHPKAMLKSTTRIKGYWGRIHAIKTYMGSMALCRGTRGDMLREAGAIDTVLWILSRIWKQLPNVANTEDDGDTKNCFEEEERAVLELGIVCLGALRDLACGNAINRATVRQLKYEICKSEIDDYSNIYNYNIKDDNCDISHTQNGLELMAMYVQRYHKHSWSTMLGTTSSNKLQLRLFTNVIGALRNVTHSSHENCHELHRLQVSEMLRWRLLYGEDDDYDSNIDFKKYYDGDEKINQQRRIGPIPKRLPDASQPWREASYRTAGTLINLSEKCEDCAVMCGSDPVLIELLIEAWGGAVVSGDSTKKKKPKQTPLLHLGLAAILHAAEKELRGSGLFAEAWYDILSKEEERKQMAQRKEEKRKQRILQSTKIKQ